jgi:hypothetical protein
MFGIYLKEIKERTILNVYYKEQIPDKYIFVNRTIKTWNQLPAGLLASFLRKLNTFRKRVKNVVTSMGSQVGSECK